MYQSGSDSLERCEKAVEALFGSPNSRFSRFDREDVARHISRDALTEIVRLYWWNDMEDRRTKGSDLKRELQKVVTHLNSLKSAMAAVQPETRNVLNRRLKPPTMDEPFQQDIFDEAERLNNSILDLTRPLVAQKYTKQASTSVANCCERLALLWEKISGQSFERNTKSSKTSGDGKLVTDIFEFENDGMHFVHVLLQAIDPDVTCSKVRSGMRRKTDRAQQNTIESKSER